jgi:hypothetical protein
MGRTVHLILTYPFKTTLLKSLTSNKIPTFFSKGRIIGMNNQFWLQRLILCQEKL